MIQDPPYGRTSEQLNSDLYVPSVGDVVKVVEVSPCDKHPSYDVGQIVTCSQIATRVNNRGLLKPTGSWIFLGREYGAKPGTAGCWCRVERVLPELTAAERVTERAREAWRAENFSYCDWDEISEETRAEYIAAAAEELGMELVKSTHQTHCACGAQLMGKFAELRYSDNKSNRCGECQLAGDMEDHWSRSVGYEPRCPPPPKPEAPHVWPQAWANPSWES